MTGRYTPAEFLALLIAMTSSQPERPDLRSQEQIDHDMRLEQAAEHRRDHRREPTSDRDETWLADRNERAWAQ